MFKNINAYSVIIILLSFALVCLLAKIIIPKLRKYKLGQNIRQEGPKSHLKKAGTPTMGGVLFIISSLIAVLVSSLAGFVFTNEIILLVLGSTAFGLVGFLDDYIKFFKHRNLGLRAYQKLVLQMLFSALIAYYAYKLAGTMVYIPFYKEVDLGKWVILLNFFILVASTNAVNLTDGLDGLATGVMSIILLTLAIYSLKISNMTTYAYSIIMFASLLGFLIFNKYPAQIFMGDTGSLFLGGVLAIITILLGLHFYMIIYALVLIMETLSVIIQVAVFKKTGKRVFLMSPLHHHFEMKGMKETKVVVMFCAWTLILCAASLVIFLR
ncbi:MAG: phospho-N-acetylmuramoyl-pentapeptide-transferase [Eubacteriales bacterium]|uniref:phospho-N-acetylmuramoyl-pentapeptide- transferase n=1 Tax=Fenollaria sp. TaxID=1965292 RepID=UPI002A7616FC|nr:phospho-N-acetylmuramoyl-pentapeptide-transferase [Fenollaria sp.]MDD7339613.1 phospho-N-acetylmuramoyl-pentapeptide-transferase [Eubacteriales bacterium]MDY3105708.1 phospho-N-acetylmuramoyl-pentapeptide-transferase [Fenollaria sp.]